jgi:hypothetical protein
MTFGAFVPIGRGYDRRTGGEGTGVVREVRVPAETTMVEALVRGGVASGDAARLSASVHPEGPMKRQKRAS